MFKAATSEGIDRAVDNADLAAPFSPPVAVRNTRATPTDSNLAFAETRFSLQIAVPDHAVMVVGSDLIPALESEEAIVDLCRFLDAEFIALHAVPATGEPHQSLARRSKRMTRAQCLANRCAVKLVGYDARDTALGPEYLGARQAAAGTSPVLVAAR